MKETHNMVERTTTNGQPDIRAILLNDMRRNTTRLGSLLERRKRLGSLMGDRRDVEELTIRMDADVIDDSQTILSRLAKQFD